MEADLAAIMLNDFGIEVTVTPYPWNGVPYILQGLFDSPFVNARMGEIPIEMQNASFSYQSSSLPYSRIGEGTEILINSVTYEVIREEKDGLLSNSGGMSTAILRIKG